MTNRSAEVGTDGVSLSWWQIVTQNAAVAAAGALATALVTVGGPAIAKLIEKSAKEPKFTVEEKAFQDQMWIRNPDCTPSLSPVWHPGEGGKRIDATICPRTGDIIVAMQDNLGRQFQYWPDLTPLVEKFKVSAPRNEAEESRLFSKIFFSTAFANENTSDPKRFNLAQNVMCQIMLPDGRGLR